MKSRKFVPLPSIWTLFLVLLLIGSFGSCKKDNQKAPIVMLPVDGLYAGKYGHGNDIPETPEKYIIYPDGKIEQIKVVTETLLAQGNWQLYGNVFTANFGSIFPPYYEKSIRAVFDNSTGKLNGTWGWGSDNINGGKIELIRQ